MLSARCEKATSFPVKKVCQNTTPNHVVIMKIVNVPPHVKSFINRDTLFVTNYLGHSSQPVKTYPVSRQEAREALHPECGTNCVAQNRHLNRKEGQAKEKMNGRYTTSLKSQTIGKLKARENATCQVRGKCKGLQVVSGLPDTTVLRKHPLPLTHTFIFKSS